MRWRSFEKEEEEVSRGEARKDKGGVTSGISNLMIYYNKLLHTRTHMDRFLLLFSYSRVLLRAVLLLLLFLRVCSKVNLCLLNVCGICAPCFSSFTSCLVHVAMRRSMHMCFS